VEANPGLFGEVGAHAPSFLTRDKEVAYNIINVCANPAIICDD
jgi:hypothetical protein